MTDSRFQIAERVNCGMAAEDNNEVESADMVCKAAAMAVDSDPLGLLSTSEIRSVLRLVVVPEMQKVRPLPAGVARPWLNALPVSGLGWMEME